LGQTLPGPADHGDSRPDLEAGMDSSHMGKEGTPHPDQKEQWAVLSHPGNTKVTLKSQLIFNIVKIFFLFHLGNGMLIINVTQSTFPLTVEFTACQILPCRGLMSQLQLQGYSFYMCPIPESTGMLVSVQSRWMWGETLGIKDTLLPFMTILRAGPDPSALERLQFLPSRTINSLLKDYSQNYSCLRHTRLLLVKINSVTHLD
jgi:hypothetical protein